MPVGVDLGNEQYFGSIKLEERDLSMRSVESPADTVIGLD